MLDDLPIEEFKKKIKQLSVDELGDLMCAGYHGAFFKAIVKERISKKLYNDK